jgi:hypothetical protein
MEHKFIKESFEVNQFLTECPAEWKHKISGAQKNQNILTVYVSEQLTPEELSALQVVVQNHNANFVSSIVSKTVSQNKQFADNLMERLKNKNILDGLSSIDQAAWVHHRLRKMDYTMSDGQTVVQLDIMNLVVSGDVETAAMALSQMQPDDMSEPHHWLNTERINWIRNEIHSYLNWPLV